MKVRFYSSTLIATKKLKARLVKGLKRFFKSDTFTASLEGYSMTFDPFPTPYHKLYEDDPSEAIRKGWETVATDMEKAIEAFRPVLYPERNNKR